MKKLSLKTPHIKLPKVSRRTLYIATAAVVVLALFSFAVVREVQAERSQKAHDAAVATQAAKEKQDLKDQVTALSTAKSAEVAKNEQICQWVRGVAPKYRITVPPLCVAPKL